ncbi:HNH endonuclease [Pseudonocardia hierapolitana]|uniref:HNH endonuclease n=1 Tax=Pseudonocardia hierapolitana TaxID=1128676 RepID=A0A561SHT4_9PSEU|nr:HNH endonuclease signature motif containing protein [Pseudonocardia hierapolitana]TWF74430.1 HNH endonuclease [Pseudonocardia hierapolitana]
MVERGKAQVIVHLDTTTGTARLDDGPEIPATTAERLACDARVQVLLNDRTSTRMYRGRNRRLATPAQIAARTVRDGEGCQFPGCTHTRHLHAHHVVPWWSGGRTDIDNLILVCSFHPTASSTTTATASADWPVDGSSADPMAPRSRPSQRR